MQDIVLKGIFRFLLLIILGFNVLSALASSDTTQSMKLFNRGVYCYNNFQLDSSLIYYSYAKNEFHKEKNVLFYIYCLINSGKIYELRNDLKQANELFDLSEECACSLVYNNTKIKKEDIIYLKYSLAYSRNQYDKIIEFGKQYLQFKSTKYNVASIYYTLGYCYYFLQDYEKSNIAYFNSLKSMHLNLNSDSFLSNVYTAIATNYYLKNEYDNSIIYNKKAKEIVYRINKNHPDLVRIYITLSIIYFTKNDFNTAINYLNEALKNPNKKSQLSYIYRSLGKSYEQMKDFKLAEEYYQKALESTTSEILKKEKISTFLSYGRLLKNSTKNKTLYLYNQALAYSLCEIGIKNSLTANCFNSLADFYKGEKNYQKAFQNYQSALISLNPVFYSMDMYSNPTFGKILSYSQYFIVLKSKADLFKEYYQISHKQIDLEMSLETYELLCNEMERQRSGFMTKDDKSFITEKYYSIYTTALQTAIQLYKLTKNTNYKERALKLAEQNKSAFLLEKFNESDSKKFAGVPDQIREKEKTIRQKIAYSEKMLYDESQKKNGNPKTKEYWESCLFDVRKANDTLAAYVKSKYEGYHRLKYNPSGISSVEIQKNLSSNEAMIEYSLSDSVLYIFVITKNKFEIFEQKSFSRNDLGMFNQCFTISEAEKGSTKSFNDFLKASYNLYEKLIKPIEAVLESKNELIIIPDDKLSLIPFESLITTKNISGITYKELSYMIKKYNIGYIQLATLLINKHHSYITDKPKLLAIAPEYGTSLFKDQTEVKQLTSDGYILNPIPGVTEEVKYLQEIDGAQIISSGKATEKTFKKVQRRYNILHLAMHAVVDSKNPMYSKLIFSESGETGEDNFLSMYELMNMDIAANLAVLSACNTGTGNFQKGEGIMNLARGFFYAGCQSVIMTLWAVDDNSSSELIKGFYKYFTKGKTKTEALRLAKLDFIEHADNIKAHPYYWAGYVNIGDPFALYPNENKKIVLIISGSLVLLILIIVVAKNRRGKMNRKKRQLFSMYKRHY